MDKKKQNLSNEEYEINKLLNEFEFEEIEIPDELDEKLNAKLKELKPKRYRKWIVTSVASLLVICFSYAFIQPFRTFADTVFEHIFGDIGIENAVNNGYKPADEQHINIGGYDMTIKNIYIDEQRINFDAVMNTKIDDMASDYSDGGNYYELYVDSKIEAAMNGGIFNKNEDGEVKANVKIVGSNVENLLDGNENLELKLKLVKSVPKSNDDDPNWEYNTLGTTTLKLEIPDELKATKNIKINKEIKDGDLTLKIYKLRVSPTMMYLNTYGKVDNIGKLQGLDNFKIISENGEVYKSSLEISALGLENGGWSQTIVPSAYYDKSKKLRLKADGVLVEANKKIEIKLNDNYPKKIDYFGNVITIKDVEYKNGKLIVQYLDDSNGVKYASMSLLDGEEMYATTYSGGDKVHGIEFKNVAQKEAYVLDLGLVIRYKCPLDVEISNKEDK
ncbi:DUF5643 domain-containing protein [Intestinibacter sp.]